MAEKAKGTELATGYVSLTVSMRDARKAISRELEAPLKDAMGRAAAESRKEIDRELAKVKKLDVVDTRRVGDGARKVKEDFDRQIEETRRKALETKAIIERTMAGTKVDLGDRVGADVEKGSKRAKRALDGISDTDLNNLSNAVLGPLNSQLDGVAATAADAGFELAGMAGSFGPQAAVIAGIAALAGAVAIARARAEELRRSHLDAASAAEQLAASVGVANDALFDNLVITDEQFRRANTDAIKTLRTMLTPAAQEGYLVQIAWEFQAATGASGQEALEHIRRLALAAGVEVPVDLTVADLTNYKGQLDALKAQATEIATALREAGPPVSDSFVDNSLTDKQKRQLDNLAQQAAKAWETQGPAAYAAALATVEQQLGGNVSAIDHFVVKAQELTEVQGLHTSQTDDTVDALRDLAASSDLAGTAIGDQINALLDEAAAKGEVNAENVGLVASQESATNAVTDYVERALKAAGASREQRDASEELSAAYDRQRSELQMLTVEYDAADAAIAAYKASMDKASRIDDKLVGGLALGDAIKEFGRGLFGLSEDEAKATSETERLNKALAALKDAAGRADPKMSALGIRLGSLSAAAEGFRRSIADSTGLDNQLTAAVDLGDAWDKLRKVARRLPPEFDAQRATMARYVPESREALRTLTQLGAAATNYLATLLETGRGHGEVRAEAARLRQEYLDQFKAIGFTDEQAQKYIRTLGLAPDQVETAIKVSGVEEARFKVQTFLQLLEGRIPAEVATAVAAKIGQGDLEGAAKMLSDFAASNPVRIDVKPEVKDENRIELPDIIDPSTAAMGAYNDAQQRGLEMILGLRDRTQEWLALVAATDGPDAAVRESERIRGALAGIFDQLGMNVDQYGPYLDMIVGTPDQVNTAVVLAGAEQSMATIQLYRDLLDNQIPDEVKTDVALAIRQGDLPKAQRLLEDFVDRQSKLRIQITADVQLRDVLTSGGMAVLGGLPRELQGRAKGGPQAANEPGIVGERGPELWWPDTAGFVVPADVTEAIVKGGDGASASSYRFGDLHFHGTETADPPEAFARRLRIMERELRR